MKASSVSSTAQAPTPLPAPAQTLFIANASSTKTSAEATYEVMEQLEHQATAFTATLNQILAISPWSHGGLNE
jgi:hypothetical protein